jgi:hypothetical protein
VIGSNRKIVLEFLDTFLRKQVDAFVHHLLVGGIPTAVFGEKAVSESVSHIIDAHNGTGNVPRNTFDGVNIASFLAR